MSSPKSWGWLLCVVASVTSADAAVLVTFDQPEYVVMSIGETFEIQILIDADDRTAAIDPVPRGLFSFGTEIIFDSTKADVPSVGDIGVVGGLNQFGFSTGAFKQVASGSAAAKGNIDQTENPLVPYEDSLLMTATLTNSAAPIDTYPLTLGYFRTLGDAEQIFVDGAGTVLDSDIVFGTAIVRVIPEPSMFSLCALAILHLGCLRRRA